MQNKNFNPSYIGPRPDIFKLMMTEARQVLDVGCSTGVLGSFIKENMGAKVYGIEISKEMANVAENKLDTVYVGDALEILKTNGFEGVKFDYIIFADTLEHMVDPWAVLQEAVKYLAPNGKIIASIPNIRHISTINNLIFRGYWPYRDRGIHDRTHLRFFCKKNIIELFNSSGLNIQKIEANYRIIEKPHRINRYARYISLPGIKKFTAFQYLVCAEKSKDS